MNSNNYINLQIWITKKNTNVEHIHIGHQTSEWVFVQNRANQRIGQSRRCLPML